MRKGTPSAKKSGRPRLPETAPAAHRILIVSDATGRTAEMVVRAALVQFRGADVELIVRPHAQTPKAVQGAVEEAARIGGLVVHTLVSQELRSVMLTEGRARNIPTIDLLGPLLLRLEDLLRLQPLSRPGLFRDADAEYRHRFEVVEYTVKHDDGQDPRGLPQADVVLLGVSRTSKTPLSMFLAGRGLRVANVPVIHKLPLPEELARVDARKVVGLTIKAERLLELRRSRLQQMETPPDFPYADPRQVWSELEYAHGLYARAGWPMVDVTDKSVEEVAAEVLVCTGIEQQGPRPAGGQPGRPGYWRRTSE